MVSLPVSTGTDAELSMHTVSGRNNPRPVHATDVCLNVKPLPSGRSVEDVLHQRTALIDPHFIEETRGEFLHSTAPVGATVLHLYNHPYRIPRPRGHRDHAVAVGIMQGGGHLYQALVGPVGHHGIRPRQVTLYHAKGEIPRRRFGGPFSLLPGQDRLCRLRGRRRRSHCGSSGVPVRSGCSLGGGAIRAACGACGGGFCTTRSISRRTCSRNRGDSRGSPGRRHCISGFFAGGEGSGAGTGSGGTFTHHRGLAPAAIAAIRQLSPITIRGGDAGHCQHPRYRHGQSSRRSTEAATPDSCVPVVAGPAGGGRLRSTAPHFLPYGGPSTFFGRRGDRQSAQGLQPLTQGGAFPPCLSCKSLFCTDSGPSLGRSGPGILLNLLSMSVSEMRMVI